MNKTIAAVSAAAMAAGFGLGAATLANAETPTPTASPTASADDTAAPSQQDDTGRGRAWDERGPGGHHRGGMHGMGGLGGMDLSALAEKLGVEEAALADALDEAMDAVRDGDSGTPEERQEALAEALASELGIDRATVDDALDELRTQFEAERAADAQEVLDQAVTDGTLTQTEADAVQKAIEAGIVGVRGGHR